MKSKILKTIHETAKDLEKAGAMYPNTLREFDALCLPPVKNYSPQQIKKIRRKSRASQAVFAAYLNTSLSTVQKWEQGKKSPKGTSLKLLSMIDRKGLEVLAS